jgi:hypothetical protein
MSRILLNKRVLRMMPETQKVMISFTSQQFKHLSEKRDVSKKKKNSNIDTTIDFVKIAPKYSKIHIFLVPKKSGIGES